MKYNLLFLAIIVLFAIGTLFVMNFQTANVVAEYQETASLNDPLSGKLTLAVEEGDSINKETPLMISLIQGKNVIAVETMPLEEFVSLSDNPMPPVKKENGEFYEQPQMYNVEISKIIDYHFTQPDTYELTFNVPKIDLLVKKV